ncbi:hypothetical protein [Pseudorhodoferax sp. Leaf265]|jgi:DNA-binding IclR family transcriptional regulator|uniref:hypothetical protein n=1 Tax=Pseudorhodoferax sp. Leaf265 TaxID=1736315 RepID=UPI0006F2C67F|nr:hypothetical protein [Pseudorhodoferax sp. Leaf265]KQP08403.1 hypothetical protein ASF45_33500 [Pseudorhodoferax sp. Leaf265]
MQDEAPLSTRILQQLAQAPVGGGMSLPRLGKRLGLNASVLMRELALMGDAAIGGVRGPGWAHVVQLDGRWVVHITPAGRAWLSADPR